MILREDLSLPLEERLILKGRHEHSNLWTVRLLLLALVLECKQLHVMYVNIIGHEMFTMRFRLNVKWLIILLNMTSHHKRLALCPRRDHVGIWGNALTIIIIINSLQRKKRLVVFFHVYIFMSCHPHAWVTPIDSFWISRHCNPRSANGFIC